MNRFLNKYPFFLCLLPLFFILHGCIENIGLIPLREASILFLKYTGAAILIAFLAWLLLKDMLKASMIAFFIIAYDFFFGSVLDFLKPLTGNSLITRYSFLIPTTLALIIIFCIYLKKSKKKFNKAANYLNWLFILLILIDTGNLLTKLFKKNNQPKAGTSANLPVCDTCSTPDIYLIIADEYAGQAELKDVFSFDNSIFLNELKKRDYHVDSSSFSNYNFTQYSIASMLDMEYLSGITGEHSSKHDRLVTFNKLKTNKTLSFLLNQGYSFYNYSIFDFNKYPSVVTPTFIAGKTSLITSQTFLNRLRQDLGYHLITTLKLKWAVSKLYYDDLYNNDKIYELTKTIAATKTKNPKFVYSHLIMPHYRYYFDSKGNPTPFEKLIDDSYCWDKKAYLEYLQYTNTKLLRLIDYIRSKSEKPPVIILMSDHGYHQFLSAEDIATVDKKYYFMTLNAVHFPKKNYSLFYNNMSNVNQFRVILNSLFAQKLPMLKDSTIFLAQ